MKLTFCLIALLMTTITFSMKTTLKDSSELFGSKTIENSLSSILDKSAENESFQHLKSENLASLNRNERKHKKGTTVKTKRTTTTTKNTNTNKAGKTLGKTSITYSNKMFTTKRKNKIKNLNLLKTKDKALPLMAPLDIYNDIIISEIELTKTQQVKDTKINIIKIKAFDLELDPKKSNAYVNKNNAILVYLLLKNVYSKLQIAIMFYAGLPITNNPNNRYFNTFED